MSQVFGASYTPTMAAEGLWCVRYVPWERLVGLQKHGRRHDLAARAFGAVNLVAVDFLRVGVVVETAG
jgi:hypothetical protein